MATDVKAPDAARLKFRTAWRRWGAAFIDGVILLVLNAPVLWAGLVSESAVSLIPLYLLNALLGLAYSIGLHGRTGQTLGKRLTRVMVVTLSEQPIGMGRAVLRDSPSLLIGVVDAAWGVTTILRGKNPFRIPQDATFLSLLGLVSLAWWLLELLTMLSNSRRRAIHDWIARTIVVRV